MTMTVSSSSTAGYIYIYIVSIGSGHKPVENGVKSTLRRGELRSQKVSHSHDNLIQIQFDDDF